MNPKEAILSYLRHHGPATYAEIASGTKLSTLLVTAILEDSWKAGKLKRTGQLKSGRIYYLPGDEERVRQKLYGPLSFSEKEILRTLIDKKAFPDHTLSRKEKEIISKVPLFENFNISYEDKQIPCWRYTHIPIEKAKDILSREIPERVEAKPVEIKKERGFEDMVLDWLSSVGEVLEKKVRKKKIEGIVEMKMPFGAQRYFFIAKDSKRSIPPKDLSLAFTDGRERKMPVIFITTTDFSKKAKEYWERHRDLMVLVDGEKLNVKKA